MTSEESFYNNNLVALKERWPEITLLPAGLKTIKNEVSLEGGVIHYKNIQFSSKYDRQKELRLFAKSVDFSDRLTLYGISNGDLPEDLIRNRITIEYELSNKIEPYVSGEFFHLYDADGFQYNENRISFGLNVDLPKKRSMKIFYTHKREDIDGSSPDLISVFGLAYDFKW